MPTQSLPTTLSDALTLVNQQLLAFTTDTKFNDKLTLTFGNAINPQSYQKLWNTPDFNLESVIEIRTKNELNGANGAFSRDTGKIYLAQEYLDQNSDNLHLIVALILEEYGHLIDAEVNPIESLGDEGAIFAQLVEGKNITAQELQALQSEDDTATVILDGETILIEEQNFTGTNGNDTITGTSENDLIQGLDGNDSLNGLGGNDNIYGGAGNDSINGGDGDDRLDGGSGIDTLDGGAGLDVLELNLSTNNSNQNINLSGTLTSIGVTASNFESFSLSTGAGNDTINGSASNDNIYGGAGDDSINGGDGDDRLDGGADNNSINGGDGDDFISGGSGIDTINGGGGDDLIYGFDGNDSINGGDGNDQIGGGSGIDTLDGGAGLDYLVLDLSTNNSNQNINLSGTIDYSGDTVSNFEHFFLLAGAGNDTINGSASNDVIFGGAGNDSINGGGGDDLIYGETGNDSINGGGGDDVIYGGRLSTLGEIDTLNGGAGGDSFILGDTYSDIYYDDGNITTNGNNDYALIDDFTPSEDKVQLQGSASNYLLVVSGANTNLYVDKAGIEPDELIAIFQNTGLNLTSSSFNYVTYLPSTLRLTSSSYSVNENGTPVTAVTITRIFNLTSAVSVTVTPSNGTATTADYTNTPIVVNFAANETSKVVTIPITNDTLVEANETVNLTLSNPTNGATLDPRGTTAVLTIIDNDTVASQLAFSSSGYSVNENGTVVIGVTINRTGNLTSAVSVTVTPSNGTATTADYTSTPIVVNFASGESSKVVTIPITNDTLVESNETVNLTLSNPTNGATLGSQTTAVLTIIDDDVNGGVLITGTTGNDSLTGGVGNDTLQGLAGNDTLNGGVGADSLEGGIGNDTYYVDNIGDLVIEAVSAGTDTVNASVNFTLATNVEKLILTGTDNLNGTGNTLANTITGNSGNNTLTGSDGNDSLNGGNGIDTLNGGNGNDTYTLDNVGDVIIDSAGTDSVSASFTYTLASNLENLTLSGSTAINGTGNTANNSLTGNSAANTLTGGDGNDTLSGGTGNDILDGGAGNDSYTLDNVGDVIIDSDGLDSVTASFTYTLASNLENLTLSGSTAINAIGNASANKLTGNTGNNTLTGLEGNDTISGGTGIDNLLGGNGNDSYTVDNSADVVIENANEGTDLVTSSVTYTLGANVENLTLSGSTAINATGNTFANTITGNTGVNTLTGLDGDDSLSGGNGNDTLLGGNGNDTLIGSAGSDSLTGGSGLDSFRFNAKTEGVDTISDFVVADDTILVSRSSFGGGLVVGTLLTTQFTIGASATTSAHRFGYESGTGKLWFDVDGNGATGATQIATLPTGLALTNADIVVF